MKHMKKLISFAVILVAFTAAGFAQASATSTATATIVGPIGITNTTVMNFGNVAVSATVAGTAVLLLQVPGLHQEGSHFLQQPEQLQQRFLM